MIWLGLFGLGIGFGVVVTSHGFRWWLAPLISVLMFAGSVEFILVGMLAVGAPIAAIALTTFLINSRHLFYGLSFPLHRVNGRLAEAYSVFALCDEAYALAASKDPETLTTMGRYGLPFQNLRTPDEAIRFPGITEDLVDLGDLTVGHSVQEPGWRWSTHLRPIVDGEWCKARHVGVVLFGRLAAQLKDGTVLELRARRRLRHPT